MIGNGRHCAISLTIVFALFGWGCGYDAGSDDDCSPGATRTCACDEDRRGVQTCNSEGNKWTLCNCGGDNEPGSPTGGENDASPSGTTDGSDGASPSDPDGGKDAGSSSECTGDNCGDYAVNLHYEGGLDIGSVVVKIFDRDRFTCQNARRHLQQKFDRKLEPSLSVEPRSQKTAAITPGARLPVVTFPDRQSGSAYTVVAQGKSRSNDRVQAAFGCRDANKKIENGETVQVDLRLEELVPNPVGEYEVTHQFNIRQGLPPFVRQIVHMVGRLPVSPGSSIFGCPEEPAPSGACSNVPGADGLLEILLDPLPSDSNFRGTIQSFMDLDIANQTSRDIADTIGSAWIENRAPDWVGQNSDVSSVTSHILESVKLFGVEGRIAINKLELGSQTRSAEIPKSFTKDGEQRAGGLQRWDAFIVNWTGQCAETSDGGECGVYRLGPGALETSADPVKGTFGAEVLTANDTPPHLRIKRHSLNASYGAIVFAMIERAILPAIFGNSCGPNGVDSCNSFDKVLQKAWNCQKFARKAVSEASVSRDTVRDLCRQIIDKTSDELRKYTVEKLSAEEGPNIQIGTPPGRPCRLYQPDPYPNTEWTGFPLPYVQRFGGEDRQKRCEWQLFISTEAGRLKTPGHFFGPRAQ